MEVTLAKKNRGQIALRIHIVLRSRSWSCSTHDNYEDDDHRARSNFFPYYLQTQKYIVKIKSSKNICWHVQFIENIFLSQCLKKVVTAKELDLRPLGKVIIFRDRQNLPIVYRLSSSLSS